MVHDSVGGGDCSRADQPLRLRGGKVGGVKAKELWEKTMGELSSLETDLRTELMSLRVAQQVGGQPGRVNRIKMVRKSIARVLTVMTSKKRAKVFRKVAKDKYKPHDCRTNRHMTKAMRQRLTRYESSIKTKRAMRAIFNKVWGAGERPMRHVLMTGDTMVEALLKKTGKPIGSIRIEEEGMMKPPKKKGVRGKKTDTGHIPEHAQIVMQKRKAAWKVEKERMKAFKEQRQAKYHERQEAKSRLRKRIPPSTDATRSTKESPFPSGFYTVV
mmetsp:Transcript_37270/g.90517  ORF Transcript_37270/g.90517 Transcript_37270/m.90517 type:complete len:271 (-) Transcript_37270:37-849(-)